MDINSFRIRLKDVNGVDIDVNHTLWKEKHGKFSISDMRDPEDVPPIRFNSLEEAFEYEIEGKTVAEHVSVWKEFPVMPLDAPDNWFELWLDTQKE